MMPPTLAAITPRDLIAMRRMALLQSVQSQMLGTVPSMPTTFGQDTVSLGQGLEPLDIIPGIPSPYSSGYLNDTSRFLTDMMALNAALEAARPPGTHNPDKPKDSTTGADGNLTVVAGNRSDGVKPKEITIHEKGDWKTRQRSDQNYGGFSSQEGSFEGAEVGKTYQVTVSWEDGSTTVRNVTLDSPDQKVYVDGAY